MLTSEPLDAFGMLATKDADELRTFLANKNLEIDVVKPNGRSPALDARINAMYFPNAYVSYLRYRVPIELKAFRDRGDYSLSLPGTGTYQAQVGHDIVHCGATRGSLGSPTVDQLTLLHEESSRFGISISHAAIVQFLETLLDGPVTEPLYFDPTVDLTTGPGRSLNRLIRVLVADAADPDHGLQHPLVSTQFEQLLIAHLITHQHHNYSKRLERKGPDPAPQDVRRVLDYIHAHLSEPITAADLVAVSGVSGRSLFAHFRRFVGQGPLAYVAEQRLAAVRRALSNKNSSASITEIATGYGIAHLGRFSQRYRRTYGELPSATLQRARRKQH